MKKTDVQYGPDWCVLRFVVDAQNDVHRLIAYHGKLTTVDVTGSLQTVTDTYHWLLYGNGTISNPAPNSLLNPSKTVSP